jgi:hypothetical protein
VRSAGLVVAPIFLVLPNSLKFLTYTPKLSKAITSARPAVLSVSPVILAMDLAVEAPYLILNNSNIAAA